MTENYTIDWLKQASREWVDTMNNNELSQNPDFSNIMKGYPQYYWEDNLMKKTTDVEPILQRHLNELEDNKMNADEIVRKIRTWRGHIRTPGLEPLVMSAADMIESLQAELNRTRLERNAQEAVKNYYKAQLAKAKAEERENGCEYCKVLTPDCCRGFFLPSIDPDCEADMVTITHCPMCGKRLEEAPSDWTKNKACRDAVLKTFGGES
jgi:hypothetical protein